MAVWQTYGVGLHECFHKLQSEQKVRACFGLALWRFVVKLHGGSVPEHGNFSSSFVLAPAAEVLPDARWPGTDKTVAQLLAALRSDEMVIKLDASNVE